MFFAGKILRSTRTFAAWMALAATVSLLLYELTVFFARRSAVPWWAKIIWFVVSLVVALGGGVIAFPRWQALVALAASILALALLVAQ